MGHVMFVALEDLMIRRARMQGKAALWVPGVDHAGIATQNVVAKALKKEGKSKEDLGRDKFVERVWEWKKEYGGNITRQLRRLGASLDWTRERVLIPISEWQELLSAMERDHSVDRSNRACQI